MVLTRFLDRHPVHTPSRTGRRTLLASLFCLACAFALPAAAAPNTVSLRCEYLVNPLGIHETAPRFSWRMNSAQRGEKQTAYQILVASSPEQLAKQQGDLWDSGKVKADQSAQVEYAGKPLHSRMRCYWTVRVWDHAGKPGSWSRPALWSMGLMEAGDWSAKWIAAPPVAQPSATPHQVVIRKASYEAVDGSAARDVTALLTNRLKTGDVDVTVANGVFGGDPAYQHVKQLRVDLTVDGKPQTVVTAENQVFSVQGGTRALPYLRKAFALSKPIRHASLYATALGVYELHLNGQRVGDHILAPEWTDYRKRIRYQEYDVTSLLHAGANALGALVAHGWYSGHLGNGGYQYYGVVPALFAQLEVTYADGSTERIVTDTSWKTHVSPILSSDFMLGENYDSRQELAGWDKPGLDESDWAPATPDNETLDAKKPAIAKTNLEATVSEPVRETGEIKPKLLKEPAKGHWTYDLGQNMVGVVRLKVSAPAGTRLTLRHAEMLNPDGTIYTANLRGAPSIDTYVTHGGGVETWQPRFTFHGFRYVELTGLPAKPGMDAVTGIVINSDTPRAGEFQCSDPRINQLQSNIQWGQRGNYLSVPTDCPQRDERMGWMGDAEVFVRTATYNADVAAFFTKWLVDVDDAQTPDGAYSDISPSYGGGGTPAWADAGVICPWTIYQANGDTRLLQKHLPNMTRWVEWCRLHSTELIRDKDRNGDYGDWLSIGADTPKDLIGTAYFAYSTHLLAKSYRAVGDVSGAEKYEQLFAEIKAAFNKRYVKEDGRMVGNTQCCYAMALKFELLPETLRPLAAKYLEDDIRAKGNHLSTGFVGVSYLLPVLTNMGKLDTAYTLLTQDTFPSWLFSVKHGATTIWERWDGWTPEKGFQDPGMNSFNHYSLGSCGEWLFDAAAGIDLDPTQVAFRHILLRPKVDGPLTWVKAHHDCLYGRIESNWIREGGALTLNVTIPPNTTATVYMPAADAATVMEGSGAAAKSVGVKFVRSEPGVAVFEVESGSYTFKAPH
jgi:alpha-L-rhamnosidase